MASSPFHFTDMLWILIPLLFTLFLMELYFGRYKFEELGWNTAFSNTLVLIFVSLDLLRYLYNNGELIFGLKTILVGSVIFLGVILTFFNFFHILPKELGFTISSKFPMNFLALCSLLIIYSRVPLDFATAGGVIILMIVTYSIIKLLNWVTPEGTQELADV